jgi:hypothetical protein
MENKNEERALGDPDIPAGALTKVSDQIRVSGEDFFSYYANSVAVSLSMWDVRFVFGEHVGEKDGKAVIEESVRILMSREIAKVLNKLLTDQIATYEKTFGVIQIPDITRLSGPKEVEPKEGLQE